MGLRQMLEPGNVERGLFESLGTWGSSTNYTLAPHYTGDCMHRVDDESSSEDQRLQEHRCVCRHQQKRPQIRLRSTRRPHATWHAWLYLVPLGG
jgi:hypothetical protein